jgi:Outer membrane receptor proteins, mostly Fe transport
MKKALYSLLLLVNIFSIKAETSTSAHLIVGQAVEKINGKEIPYATASLLNGKEKVIKKVSGDANGKFSIPVDSTGKYMLVLAAFGFKETRMPVEVTGLKNDVGAVRIEEGIGLKEVAVIAQKPLVKVEVDKITYSIESDPDAQTSNGLEILRKVPLIAVDAEENVTLNGQSNYKVLVNGKSSSMMSSNFKEVIKSLPANSIKDIEVITNPPSKYEAEGVGGIINIITQKKTLNGYNGNINAGIDSRGRKNVGIYLSTKINKFGLSARYSGSQFNSPQTGGFSTNENTLSETYRTSRSDYKQRYNGNSGSYNGEASYEIDTFNLVSASFWGYTGGYENKGKNISSMYDTNGNLSRYFENNTFGKSTYGYISGNIDFQKTFMKPEKTFTISYKLDADPGSSKSNNDVSACFNYTPYTQRSVSDNLEQEHTIQIDYYDPLTKMHQIECGVKAILRNNSNNSDQFRNDTLRIDQSNDLNYDQYILGAYAGYVFKLKKFTAKSGLRLERTWNDGISKAASEVRFSNRLLNLVPYITMSYQPKQGNTFKLSYTQRLQRPGIYYLNPYVDNTNPLSISYGNPNLVSEVAHSFETGYSLYAQKISLNTSLNASINNNSIEDVSTMNDMGVTTRTFKNIGMDRRYSWNNYFSYRLGAKFNLNTNFTGNYVQLKANNGYNLANNGFGFRGSLGFRTSLWKEASLSGNAGYSSPSIYLQGKYTGYTYTSFGLSQYLLKKKVSLNLSISEPFKDKKTYVYDTKGVGYTSHSEFYQLNRTIRFNVSYNFGKLDSAVKKARRGISNDDVKSGGSSTGGQ